MKEFKDHFLDSSKLQPQIFTLILVTLILITLSIVVYVKVKKQKPNKAPEGIVYFAEQYVMGIDNIYKETTDGRLNKIGPYILTLISFIGVGNLTGLIGLDPLSTTYSFTFTLALIAWIGIYVVGIMYQKWRFFKRFLNPVEWIGQFAPFISLSFRMFGNIIGGATIMYLIYAVTGWVWGFIPVLGEFNLLGPIIAPPLHMYFDIFGGIIQAFVFTLLTMIYWTIEAEPEAIEKKAQLEKTAIKDSKIIKAKKSELKNKLA